MSNISFDLSLIYRYIIIEALVGLYIDMSCNQSEEECKQSHMHFSIHLKLDANNDVNYVIETKYL